MELKILSGGAANGLVDALRAAFRERTGMEVAGDFGAVGGMRDRVLDGEEVDLVILTRAVIDGLVEAGRIDPASVTDIGAVVTGVAVPDGSPLPPVSNSDALREAFREASALYCPDTQKATAGIHFARVLEALGLGDDLRPPLREFPNGQTAMAEMARSGDARAVGCTQVTEILNTHGVTYAGPLPAPHDLSTVYTAGIATAAASAEAAGELISLLVAPEHAEIRRKVGFT